MYPKRRLKDEPMTIAEAQVLVRRIAEPCPAGDSVKAAIGRAAKALGWNWSRTKDLWYADQRCRPDQKEMESLRNATRDIQQAIERLVALRDALAVKDAVFHQLDIHSLERALRAMGHKVAPADVSER